MNAPIDLSSVVLHTERLTLRPFEESDLDDLYEYASVPGVGEMAGWPHHTCKEDSKKILSMFIEEKKTFALVKDGKVIGSLGVEAYNEKLLPELASYQGREIGYVLSKAYWGQGLMPEAVKEVIRYCFEELHLDVLVCGHFDFNANSYRAQQKVGFAHYKSVTAHNDLWDKDVICWTSLLFRDMKEAEKFHLK